jgi:hypothetical protein
MLSVGMDRYIQPFLGDVDPTLGAICAIFFPCLVMRARARATVRVIEENGSGSLLTRGLQTLGV